MKTISNDDLAMVTGGKTPDATIPANTGSSGGSDNSAILGALHGIQGSLKDLNKPRGGMFSGNNGLMFGMMAGLALRNNNNNAHYSVSYNYGGGGGRFGFRYWG